MHSYCTHSANMEKQIAQITAQEILRRKLPLGEFGHPVWPESYVISAMEEYALSERKRAWEEALDTASKLFTSGKCEYYSDAIAEAKKLFNP